MNHLRLKFVLISPKTLMYPLSSEMRIWQQSICFLLLFVFFILECIIPKRKVTDSKKDRLFFHFGLFLFNSIFFTVLIAYAEYEWISKVSQFKFTLLNVFNFSLGLRLILCLILFDLCGYFIHRAHHAIPLLWSLHEVHHSDTNVDFTTGFRSHFGQLVSSAVLESIAILLIGPTVLEFFIYSSTLFIAVHFHHSNIKLPNLLKNFLSKFVVTPDFHLHHHAAAKKHYDTHFSGIFCIWDSLFGTKVQGFESNLTFRLGNNLSHDLDFETLVLLPVYNFFKLLRPALASLCLLFLFFSACTKKEVPKISLELQNEIDYGRELIAHTARYLGPKGSVGQYTNTRMNCQNCHLDAGKKEYGISFMNTFTKYPDFRAREAKLVTLEDRINHCFERPMNGKPIPREGREMKAILVYLRSLSIGRVVGEKKLGDNPNDIVKFPSRAADSLKGHFVFKEKCASCHGEQGQGKLTDNNVEFIYPPLWGEESYNAASNMHRLIKSAAFIKANMPLGATWDKPKLSDEEAFDVAAFINDESIHKRPLSKWKDYPQISLKPIDFPVGPYADNLPDLQHRLGPYPPMIEFLNRNKREAYY